MNRIKEILEEKEVKQSWLAEKLGKRFSIVNAYACNRRQPRLEQLFEIAKFFKSIRQIQLTISEYKILINSYQGHKDSYQGK